MELQEKQIEQPKKRPELLTILCILTFIGSGLQGISNIFVFSNQELIIEQFIDSPFYNEDMHKYFETDSKFFLLNSMVYFTSLLGAIYMWRLKKIGFHLYTMSQIAVLFIFSIYKPMPGIPTLEIIVTGLFIFLYYRNLKFMS